MPVREQKQLETPAYEVYAFDHFPNGNPLCHRGGYDTKEAALDTPAKLGYECVILVGRDGTQEVLKGNVFKFSEALRRIVPNWKQEENVAKTA